MYGYQILNIEKKDIGGIYKGVDPRLTIFTIFRCTLTLINNASLGVDLQFAKVL